MNAQLHAIEIYKNINLIHKWFQLSHDITTGESINSCKQMIKELEWLHSKYSDNSYLERINHYKNVIKELKKL